MKQFVRQKAAVGDHFEMLCGVGEILAPSYSALGVKGFTSGLVNFMPQTSLAIMACLQKGLLEEASRIVVRDTLAIFELRVKHPGYSTSVIKEAMNLCGIPAGPVRPPLPPLFASDVEDLRKILRSCGALKPIKKEPIDADAVKYPAMELRHLETFRIVMATQSMTEAAKRVYLSPAAVSLQIKHLSDELGADLFTRVGNKLVPTAAAKRMHQHLGGLMDILHTIREDFPPGAEFDVRPFVLGTGPTTLIYQLRRPLSHLRKQFPRNEIRVHVAPTQDIIYELEWKQIDLGIVSLPVDAPRLQLTPLFKEEMLVFMHARTATKYGKSITMKDLATIPMILYPAESSTRVLIDGMVRKHGISLRVTMEADDTEGIKKLVEAGFGASILPEKALHSSALAKTLRIEGEKLYRELALATPSNAHPRQLTTAISAYLKKHLSA